jgi:hypothetical protein
MNARTDAGRKSKLDGHSFEAKLARKIGNGFVVLDQGVLKTDISNGEINFSVKNSDSPHTQVALIGQSSLINKLKLDDTESVFVKLFFGFADGSCLNPSKLTGLLIKFSELNTTDEINRNRLLYSSIPLEYSIPFMDKLNRNTVNKSLMRYLVQGSAHHLAWTTVKNDVENVKCAKMDDVIDFLSKGQWRPSKNNTTLELLVDCKRYMYLQMKGSSKRFSAGYHSCMFHLYKDVMNAIPHSII